MAELFVAATPIGNLMDLTPRLAETLKRCDLIVAEDTRVTMKLLHHLGIKKPLLSMNRHTEQDKAGTIVERMLREDLSVCLTCDAGTPGISDPGVPLVAAAHEAGIRVTPISGPSAMTTHLSACGFDARTFGFYGFLPREKGALARKIGEIGRSGLHAAVLYESPRRVVELVETIGQVLPGCSISVACDLTKRFEKIRTGPWAQVLEALRADPNVEKGEYSLVIALPPAPEDPEPVSPEALILEAMLQGADLDSAAREVLLAGAPRNKVYKAKLKIRDFLRLKGEEA